MAELLKQQCFNV